jgi:hypothetical protein
MKKLGTAVVVVSLGAGAFAASVAGQGYQAPRRANHKDVYCSGFFSSTRLPADLRIVMGEDAVGRVSYSQHDFIYLSHGSNGGVRGGTRYLVVRPYNDPNPVQAFGRFESPPSQGSLLRQMGQHYQDIGVVEVKYVHETTSTAYVLEACDMLHAGDVLIPYEDRPAPEYKPSSTFDRFTEAKGRGEGTIVTGKEYTSMYGQGDIIFVNVGSGQGAKAGDYLRLYRNASGTKYKGYDQMGQGQLRKLRGMPTGYEIPRMRPDLPREVLGEALIVRVDSNSAVAVITYSVRESHAGDYVELE